MKKTQRAPQHKRDWVIKGENNQKHTKALTTQKEAHTIAGKNALNQKPELILTAKNGQIRQNDNTGSDAKIIK